MNFVWLKRASNLASGGSHTGKQLKGHKPRKERLGIIGMDGIGKP
jgi:lactate dehydrogenase-like 2-hydroxyacid dehydrogenase